MDAPHQREIVRRGYDAISRDYRGDDEASDYHAGWVAELAGLVPARSRVLDLGCGCGVPAARLLVDRGFEVVGLDFSRVQIERARELVPGATFVEADMAAWDAEPGSFDAVVSFYALIHVPMEDQRALFPRLRPWLRGGGIVMAIVGHEAWTGVEEYFGAPMFWARADAATYETWFREAGFEVLSTRFYPEGDSGHALVVARAGT